MIQSNLKFLRKHEGLTQEGYATELGIKRSLLGAYEEGRAKPNYELLQKIADRYGLTMDQLIREDVSTLPEIKDGVEASKLGSLKVLSITVDQEGNENIELVQQKAAAGYLNGYADPTYIEELPKFRLPFMGPGTYRAFEISGDSMLPIQPGSIIIGEYVDSMDDVKDGETHIIVSSQDGVVYKRVHRNPTDNTQFTLSSDNPAYQPFPLKALDILEIWKAKVHINFLDKTSDINVQNLMTLVKGLQDEVNELKSKNN